MYADHNRSNVPASISSRCCCLWWTLLRPIIVPADDGRCSCSCVATRRRNWWLLRRRTPSLLGDIILALDAIVILVYEASRASSSCRWYCGGSSPILPLFMRLYLIRGISFVNVVRFSYWKFIVMIMMLGKRKIRREQNWFYVQQQYWTLWFLQSILNFTVKLKKQMCRNLL